MPQNQGHGYTEYSLSTWAAGSDEPPGVLLLRDPDSFSATLNVLCGKKKTIKRCGSPGDKRVTFLIGHFIHSEMGEINRGEGFILIVAAVTAFVVMTAAHTHTHTFTSVLPG